MRCRICCIGGIGVKYFCPVSIPLTNYNCLFPEEEELGLKDKAMDLITLLKN
jgi:hypothetical protein